MRHIICGRGGLAFALFQTLDEAVIHRDPKEDLTPYFQDGKPTTLWWVHGGTTSNHRWDNFYSHTVNVAIPRHLLEYAPYEVRLVFFSTLECCHPDFPILPHRSTPQALSPWALRKLELESLVAASNRANTALVRMGNLYGGVAQSRTFPGCVRSQVRGTDGLVCLPMNDMVPTEIEWAVRILVEGLDTNLFNASTYTTHHLSPTGSIPAFDWAKMIAERERIAVRWLEKIVWDHTRPRRLVGGSTIQAGGAAQHWSTVWLQSSSSADTA